MSDSSEVTSQASWEVSIEHWASATRPDTAITYTVDLIEHDGEDMRNRPFLDRKAALARLLRNTEAGIRFNEHIAEDGPIVFAHACRLGAEGIVSKRVDGT
jgi:bifunctional non-homologous end joining protein LigD